MNKRQKKKNLKKQLKKQVATSRKLTEKEIKKYDFNTLISISQAEEKRQQRKDAKKRLRNRKKQALEKQGINPFEFTLKEIDSIKVKDIENGYLDRKHYPRFFENVFDFSKVYTLKNNEEMYIAFRDFAGETSLEQILSDYQNKSNDELLSLLEQIVREPKSYSKRSKTGSSGSAGDYKFTVGQNISVFADRRDSYNSNRRKRTKQVKGNYKGYQTLKNGHYNTFKQFTPRAMLIVANAIMRNVTENDRFTFYESFYYEMCKHAPDFGEILPNP